MIVSMGSNSGKRVGGLVRLGSETSSSMRRLSAGSVSQAHRAEVHIPKDTISTNNGKHW